MENSNNQAAKPLTRRGSFRVSYGNEEKLIILCAIAAVLCLCMMITGLVLFGAPESFIGFMGSLFWVIPAAVCLILIPVLFYGRNCSYFAGEKEMELITPHGSEYLYYSEVTEIIYKQFTLFGKPRGYNVTVVTKSRDFSYRFIIISAEQNDPKHTPFFLLEINAGLKQPEQSDPESAAAVMAQFALMQEQQEDRLSKKRKKKTWENLFDDR